MPPLIGIVASMSAVEDGFYSGNERFFAGKWYTDAIIDAGGLPVILPWTTELAAVNNQLNVLHGLMLIGGYDVDPALYGEEPLSGLGPVFPERDAYEIAALRMAVCQQKPILGVCRGMQVINVAFGGTLYQDLSHIAGPVLQHQQKGCQVMGHSVNLEQGTILAEIFAQDKIRTNSFHHQAVRDIAPGFTVNAHARDGVIEGLENREAAILGLQWHPEMMTKLCPAMRGIFRWLVDVAAEQAEGWRDR